MANTKPFRLLEITIISAQDLEPKAKMNMRTYTTAWINPARKQTTILDTEGGSNPMWNDKFVFKVDEAFLRQETSAIEFEIYKITWLGDSLIGTVRLLVGNLIPPPSPPNHHQNLGTRFAAVQVRRPSGRPQGILNIGVAVLDGSKRSTPLDRYAAGYDNNNLHRNNNHRGRELSRSRSDRSEFLGLDSAPLDSAAVAIPKKRRGNKKVDDDKESSVLGMSWYQTPPPPPPAETNVSKKGNKKVNDDKESSVLDISWYQMPPPPPPGTNVSKKSNKKVEDDQESSVLGMSWYQAPPPPPPITTEKTNVNKKFNKFNYDKGSSILSTSWYQPQPPPTEETKGKASSVINAADVKNKSYQKGKAISVVSDSITIKDSSPSGKIGNKNEAQAKNKEVVENKNGPRFDDSPTNKTVDGKPNIPKIPGYDYGSAKPGTGSRLVIGGGPYKANSIMSDSEVGPSPSEVAAAMAERPRYPLEDSVLDGWSCDESVEGLRSRLERWRTEVPPLYDQVGYAPTSSSFRSSSQYTAKKRGSGSGGGGPLSCFGNIFGYECQCVCGQPKTKTRAGAAAAKGRVRSPSPFR
ncbi:PREDICTED: uncharacterized protein LOC109176368 [Ipomoea nil]|uniref:uncharacterized protein LOC109176368 n=1 Tax=Ipomoea nil TaxID=35883 RepID=UPI000900AA78|nr:PREDICTED: uncharacterized protein LOC109176368 [Ipomoea nil]